MANAKYSSLPNWNTWQSFSWDEAWIYLSLDIPTCIFNNVSSLNDRTIQLRVPEKSYVPKFENKNYKVKTF